MRGRSVRCVAITLIYSGTFSARSCARLSAVRRAGAHSLDRVVNADQE